jgi:hypothetical protein
LSGTARAGCRRSLIAAKAEGSCVVVHYFPPSASSGSARHVRNEEAILPGVDVSTAMSAGVACAVRVR